MKTNADKVLLFATGLFVAGLAVVAGAISFAHMVELAARHDQFGWKAYAFPVSVDGLEIVASLFLVTQHRAGRPTGWIPWVALIVGTVASLAANVAVGGHDIVGKAMAGWPALSMLVSVKLLFAMFDHTGGDDQRTVRDDQRPSAAVPAVPGPVRRTGRDEPGPSGMVPAGGTEQPVPSPATPPGPPAGGDATGHGAVGGSRGGDSVRLRAVEVRDVAYLIPAARAARATLAAAGRRLSRDALAAAMREDGHGVSNAGASLLLRVLRAEDGATPFAPIHRAEPTGHNVA